MDGHFPKLAGFALVLIGESNNHGLVSHLDPSNKKNKIP